MMDAIDPYSRPARRTQWIVSTLAYHYGLDRGVENEIIVLATGLDQYLQEIFHHMDYQGAGKVSVEDFNILCEVLGLNKEVDTECSLESLPSELTFRHFHAKLCGYFSTKAGCQYENGRLLVGKDSEHIETQIRLRSPLRRREKLLSAVLGEASEGRHASGCRLGSCTKECYEEIVALEEAEDRVVKLEDENASLRELIEDMRAALQSSDARCMALQVLYWCMEAYSASHVPHSAVHSCCVAWDFMSLWGDLMGCLPFYVTCSLDSSMWSMVQLCFLCLVRWRRAESSVVKVAVVCDDKALKKLMSHYGSSRSEESCSAVLELLERVTRLNKHLELKEGRAEVDMEQMKDSLVQELQQKAEETELLQVELQMLETERVRLSLVEEKLVDILQLLQQLRDLNVSRRSLGKILLSTLGCCSDPQHGKAHILEVLNALYHELAACEILSAAGPLERTQSQQSLNALVISC
ncbi:EF-hand and coiled-coil domain-containing protein 1 [Notothenia coriiceps]|uniref:EF-hand and coiled-coil domain-containing protein 1 n=1 Tax=Notothenia coriiceps TaxID=8208 RepID=A0A6I9NKN7_9TELE|nr:PREDICTED: EF-hand and coiled-coil domain-containing protein 1-like [Notothenia coriiceps]